MDVKCLAHEGLGAFIGREGLGRSVNQGILEWVKTLSLKP